MASNENEKSDSLHKLLEEGLVLPASVPFVPAVVFLTSTLRQSF